MKKVFKLLLLMIAFVLPSLGQRTSVQAEEMTQKLQVVVQHQFENPNGSEMLYGTDIPLSLYDISQEYATKETPKEAKEFIESFSQMSANQLNEYLTTHNVTKVQTAKTDSVGKAYFEVSGTNNAYLIVQDSAIKGQTIVPLAFSLPLQNEDGSLKNTIELYTKPITLTNRAYFYKYSSGDDQKPLKGAQFVLAKSEAGQTKYLNATEDDFITSADPSSDKQIKKFVSAENGLVLCDIFLAQGSYFFSEVKAPSGYEITSEAKKVEVEVHADMQITVKGQKLAELVGGLVPSSFTEAPKVLNDKKSLKDEPTTPQKPTDQNGPKGEEDTPNKENMPNRSDKEATAGEKLSSHKTTTAKGNGGGMLAQLGEKNSLISVLGALIVSFAAIALFKQRKERSERK